MCVGRSDLKIMKILSKNFSLTHLFFVCFGVLIILLQGCFSGIATVLLSSILIIWLFFNADKCSFSKNIIPVFLISVFVLVGYIVGKSIFLPAMHESFKWLFLVACILCFTSGYKNSFTLGIYIGITFSALLGILAFFRLIPSEFFGLVQLAENIDGTRQVYSLFGYSNSAALFFGAAIFLGIYFYRFIPRHFTFLCIMLNIVAFVLTYSYLAFACLAVALLGYYASSKKKTGFYIIAVMVLIIAGVLGLYFGFIPVSTLVSRLIYAEDGVKVILSSPLGIGYGVWGDFKYSVQSAIYSTNYLHNGFLQLALEGGVHVLLSFLFFVVYAFVSLYKSKDENRLLGIYLLLYILLHSFVDIDMAYGALYPLIAFAVSFGVCDTTKIANIKTYAKLSLAVVAILAPICCPVYIIEQRENAMLLKSSDYYREKTENAALTASEAAYLYEGACKVHDAESMYYFSCIWLDLAPRSQEAFSAVYDSINKVYTATLDEKYISVSMKALYRRMEDANSSMNPLCRYLSKNKHIELP